MKLSLATKFNLVFLITFAVGFAAATVVTNYMLQENARQETLQNVRLLMQAARAARAYTTAQVVPLLQEHLLKEFVPQSVPSYAN